MTQDYGLTSAGDYSPKDLIAGAHPPVEIAITVASGANAMTEGTILGKVTASGKYKAYAAGGSDGTQTACAILSQDTPQTSSDIKAYAYVHGVFNKNALTGYTTAAEADLQAHAIWLKEVY